MPELVLKGCTPTPLASYLKALGVLRLLSTADPSCRGAWRGDRFVIRSELDEEAVHRFLLHEYRPSPVSAPWNGGSGFFEKDSKDALNAIRAGAADRLSAFRAALDAGDQALEGFDRAASPKQEDKQRLLTRVRALLPDEALDWLDAALLLTDDGPKFPPLLGTGGNDGRLDFTNNFMQRLVELFDVDTGEPMTPAAEWLDMALQARPAPALVRRAIGQFSPGQVGGPNSSTGLGEKGNINPWDFVLMIEGALAFAATTARKHAHESGGAMSFPFTVRPTAAGAGNLGLSDAGSARAELWMPLWAGFACYGELASLLAEGRVALGRRPARDALDFVRAVNRLGGYRGIDQFQRYGLMMRSGKAFLAMPLQRVTVAHNPESEWIDELDRGGWLSAFRSHCAGDNVARRFHVLRRRLEDALFEFSVRGPTALRVQAVLELLGSIQQALATSSEAREKVGPLPLLEPRWLSAADDGSSAYRIARALAAIRGEADLSLPLRCHLFPIHPDARVHRWMDQIKDDPRARAHPAMRLRLTVPQGSTLIDTLIEILHRRLWLANRLAIADKPLQGVNGVTAEDWLEFIHNPDLDRRLNRLLVGFALIGRFERAELPADDTTLPAAAGLLKLSMTPDAVLRRVTRLGDDQRMPIPTDLVRRLASGSEAQARRAVESAWRRLRSSGLEPVIPRSRLPSLSGLDPRRVAAGLLIPLSFGATARQARSLLMSPEMDNRTIEHGERS